MIDHKALLWVCLLYSHCPLGSSLHVPPAGLGRRAAQLGSGNVCKCQGRGNWQSPGLGEGWVTAIKTGVGWGSWLHYTHFLPRGCCVPCLQASEPKQKGFEKARKQEDKWKILVNWQPRNPFSLGAFLVPQLPYLERPVIWPGASFLLTGTVEPPGIPLPSHSCPMPTSQSCCSHNLASSPPLSSPICWNPAHSWGPVKWPRPWVSKPSSDPAPATLLCLPLTFQFHTSELSPLISHLSPLSPPTKSSSPFPPAWVRFWWPQTFSYNSTHIYPNFS